MSFCFDCFTENLLFEGCGFHALLFAGLDLKQDILMQKMSSKYAFIVYFVLLCRKYALIIMVFTVYIAVKSIDLVSAEMPFSQRIFFV